MRNLLIFFIILLNNYLIASDPKLVSNKGKIDQVTDDTDHKAKKAKLNEENKSNSDDVDHFIDMGAVVTQIQEDANKKTIEAILKIFGNSDLKSCLAQCENIKDPETESKIRNIIISKYVKQLKDVIKEGLSSGISSDKSLYQDIDIKNVKNRIESVVCNKDATFAMVVYDNQFGVLVLDIKNNNIVFSAQADGDVFPAFSPDGKYLAINTTSDSISLFKTDEKFEPFKSFKFEKNEYKTKTEDGYSSDNSDNVGAINISSFSKCGKYIAGNWVDDDDSHIRSRIWDIETGKRVCEWFKPKEFQFIEFSSDDKHILSSFGGSDGHRITFSPDSKYIALTGATTLASLWDKEAKSKISLFEDKKDIRDFKSIVIWDINAKAFTKIIKFQQCIDSIRFSPSNIFLIVICNEDYMIRSRIYYYNFITDTLLNYSIIPYISNICLDNSGNKLIIGLEKSLKIIDYSNLWIMNYINIKDFMFIAKLILNPTDSSLNWKEFIDNFSRLPAQTGIELIQFVLPRLILEHTNIDLDPSKIISQYVGLHDDLSNAKLKALVETIYPKIA